MNKRMSIYVILLISTLISQSFAGWVNGYYRKDGTYVQGYWRTEPNKYKFDNYSFKKWDSPYLTDWVNKSYFSDNEFYKTLKALEDNQKALDKTWVNGYYRKDGTYVPGYWRTPPNEYKYDNKNFNKWDSPYLTDWYNQSYFSDKEFYKTLKALEDNQKAFDKAMKKLYKSYENLNNSYKLYTIESSLLNNYYWNFDDNGDNSSLFNLWDDDADNIDDSDILNLWDDDE